MAPSEWFELFNEDSYRRRISTYSEQEIRTREIIKRRQIYGATIKIAAGGGLAIASGGTSLIGSAIGGRQMSIAAQKLRIIQSIMKERGWRLPKETMSDTIVPFCTGVAGIAVGGCLDAALDPAVSAGAEICAQEGVHEAVQHTVMESASAAIQHPTEHGLQIGLDQASCLVETGNTVLGSHNPLIERCISATSAQAMDHAMSLGHEAAASGVHQTALGVGQMATHQTLDYAFEREKRARKKTRVRARVREVRRESSPPPLYTPRPQEIKVTISWDHFLWRHDEVVAHHRQMDIQAEQLRNTSNTRACKTWGGKWAKEKAEEFSSLESRQKNTARAIKGMLERDKADAVTERPYVTAERVASWAANLNEMTEINEHRQRTHDAWRRFKNGESFPSPCTSDPDSCISGLAS